TFDMPTRAGIAADRSAAKLICAVHQPDRGLAGIVLPQNVRLAITVEVTRTFDMPTRAGIAADRSAAKLICAVHQPDRGLAGIVLPQDVGLGVTVEVVRGCWLIDRSWQIDRSRKRVRPSRIVGI